MRLTDVLQLECVKVPLTATDKQQAVFELIDLLAGVHGLTCGEDLKRAVWERETTRTTGIGHGIAIPHGKIKGCPRLLMAMGKPAQPLEFGAIDGKPVSLIILLASPESETGPHIRALATVSQMLVDDAVRKAFMDAPDAATMHQLVSKHQPA
ncbi:MAG: PTS sugar transporter subunit IIA [Phycisphaeraceae bacterium]|nr:PTS sugar transporter subunit IIA [Phycisphaeraceae bacterium]